jgi:hypothetical protein
MQKGAVPSKNFLCGITPCDTTFSISDLFMACYVLHVSPEELESPPGICFDKSPDVY